jgi:hypothetical protein
MPKIGLRASISLALGTRSANPADTSSTAYLRRLAVSNVSSGDLRHSGRFYLIAVGLPDSLVLVLPCVDPSILNGQRRLFLTLKAVLLYSRPSC